MCSRVSLLILAGKLSRDHTAAKQMSAILEKSIVCLMITLGHMMDLPSEIVKNFCQVNACNDFFMKLGQS